MDEQRDRNDLLVLDEPTCWELLGSVPVGRLAFTLHGEAAIRPMNHLTVDGTLLVVTRSGSKLEAVLSEPGRQVAYEADAVDPARHGGWSVIVRGHLHPVLDLVEQQRYDALGPPAWVDTSGDRRWLRLEPTRVTGRRLDADALG